MSEGIDAMTQDGKQELPARPRPSDGWTENAICYGEIEANAYMNALEALGAQQVCEIERLTAAATKLRDHNEQMENRITISCGRQESFKRRAQKAETELARERELVRWRDVKQELPADFTDVLVYGEELMDSYVVAWKESDDPLWYETDGNQSPLRYVTHWKPLPAPPALLETKPLAPEPVDTQKEG